MQNFYYVLSISFYLYDKPIKTIPENKLEEDTMAKKQKSPEAEAEPTAK